MIYKGLNRYIINAYIQYIYSDSVHFNNNSYAIFISHTVMFSRQQFEHVLTKIIPKKNVKL
jgi:hypothetical protein